MRLTQVIICCPDDANLAPVSSSVAKDFRHSLSVPSGLSAVVAPSSVSPTESSASAENVSVTKTDESVPSIKSINSKTNKKQLPASNELNDGMAFSNEVEAIEVNGLGIIAETGKDEYDSVAIPSEDLSQYDGYADGTLNIEDLMEIINRG